MVTKTLTTLEQLGVGNVGLLTTHFAPIVQDIVEDVLIELLDEPIQTHYLHLVQDVEKRPNDEASANSLRTFSSVLASTSAESKSRDEFHYLVHTQLRVYKVWKELAEDVEVQPEEQVEDNCYRQAAAHVARNKTHQWAADTKTRLPIVDSSDLANTIYVALKDGSYFTDELYDRSVEMAPNGSLRLTGEEVVKADPEDDWQELFKDDLPIQ